MKKIKIGMWLLIGLITSAVKAQNTNLMLWEENLEQLATEAGSTDWEDELTTAGDVSFPVGHSGGKPVGIRVCAWRYADVVRTPTGGGDGQGDY